MFSLTQAAVRHAEYLPARYRSFEHTSSCFRSVHGNRGENARLIEQVRPVANRDVRERPGSIETNHARADAPERICNARQVLVLEFGQPAGR